jgi:hypothetical protein
MNDAVSLALDEFVTKSHRYDEANRLFKQACVVADTLHGQVVAAEKSKVEAEYNLIRFVSSAGRSACCGVMGQCNGDGDGQPIKDPRKGTP